MKQVILSVKRPSRDNCFFYEKLVEKANNKGIDLDTFFTKYRGIEGYSSCNNLNADRIVVDTEKEKTLSTLGFDVGILDVEYYSYSSIFQEIIFSSNNYFQSFFKQLNNSHLFNDYQVAYNYLENHKSLNATSADIESVDNMVIYRIISC